MVILSASFKAKEGVLEELFETVQGLAEKSRMEEGCLRYDFCEDVLEPGTFLFFELWRSREALQHHFTMPYFHAFAARIPDFAEGEPEILTYDTAGPVPAF